MPDLDLTLVESIAGLVAALTAGGFLSNVWSTLVGRRSRKLSEAELLEKMSAAFRREIREENSDLRERMSLVIRGLTRLTDAVDDFLIRVPDVPEEERKKLREANNEAKLAS